MSGFEASKTGDQAVLGASDALADIWRSAGLPVDELQRTRLHGTAHGFDSSFAVAEAAQSAIAAAALAAVSTLAIFSAKCLAVPPVAVAANPIIRARICSTTSKSA